MTRFAWKGVTDFLVVSVICSLLDDSIDYNSGYFIWFAYMSQLFCFGVRFLRPLISQLIPIELKSASKKQAEILISCLTL